MVFGAVRTLCDCLPSMSSILNAQYERNEDSTQFQLGTLQIQISQLRRHSCEPCPFDSPKSLSIFFAFFCSSLIAFAQLTRRVKIERSVPSVGREAAFNSGAYRTHEFSLPINYDDVVSFLSPFTAHAHDGGHRIVCFELTANRFCFSSSI